MSDHSKLKKVAEALEGVTSVSSVSDCDKFNAFYRAISPATVLALIAEVEGLRAQICRDSTELRNLCQARDDARKERDQLKEENDNPRTCRSSVNAAVAIEVEAMRKDAERYRWIMENLDVRSDGDYLDGDADVDAAMTKGDQP